MSTQTSLQDVLYHAVDKSQPTEELTTLSTDDSKVATDPKAAIPQDSHRLLWQQKVYDCDDFLLLHPQGEGQVWFRDVDARTWDQAYDRRADLFTNEYIVGRCRNADIEIFDEDQHGVRQLPRGRATLYRKNDPVSHWRPSDNVSGIVLRSQRSDAQKLSDFVYKVLEIEEGDIDFAILAATFPSPIMLVVSFLSFFLHNNHLPKCITTQGMAYPVIGYVLDSIPVFTRDDDEVQLSRFLEITDDNGDPTLMWQLCDMEEHLKNQNTQKKRADHKKAKRRRQRANGQQEGESPEESSHASDDDTEQPNFAARSENRIPIAKPTAPTKIKRVGEVGKEGTVRAWAQVVKDAWSQQTAVRSGVFSTAMDEHPGWLGKAVSGTNAEVNESVPGSKEVEDIDKQVEGHAVVDAAELLLEEEVQLLRVDQANGPTRREARQRARHKKGKGKGRGKKDK
ncbi:hypothetical protein AAFC00_002030 [Neodothiora populina]|uniref:Uncharacterized protein n=1 Tax=Neodothiora populina TaxID=2781224 RepID=A0ABR3PG13_9PEZI